MSVSLTNMFPSSPSIAITITNKLKFVKKHTLTNETPDILNIIDDIQEYVNYGATLDVFLYDPDTTAFHKYTFDYLTSSKMYPRHWLLNNIMYSLVCGDSKNFKYLVVPV